MIRPFVLVAALLAGVPPAVPVQVAPSVFAGADPDGMVAEGVYWIYPTDSGRGDRLFSWSSRDLKRWRRGPALLTQKQIGWIKDDKARIHYLWAPHMAARNGFYYFYYSVGPQNPTPSRIGVATCTTPAGPCTDSGKPLVTGGDGFEAIDPAVFVDPKTGTRYLFAGGSAGRKLRAWTLKPDMVAIEREVPVDTPPSFTEGAFMHLRNGNYYLSYSAGEWNRSSYQVHYATASAPTGPWHYRGVILTGDATYKGPGHHSFFENPKTRQWYVTYHRWEGEKGEGPYRGDRRVVVQKLEYRMDGTIVPILMTQAIPRRD